MFIVNIPIKVMGELYHLANNFVKLRDRTIIIEDIIPKMRSHSTNLKCDRTIIIEDIIPKMRSHSTNLKCDRTIIIEDIMPKCDRIPQTQNAIAYSSLVIIASFNSSTVVPNIFATSFNKSSSWVV